MPISFTDKFKINKDILGSNHAFDPIIDLDTKFFIDPALIELCSEPEFINAREKINNFFSSIIILLKHEDTQRAIYLIVDNGHPKKVESFINKYNELDSEIKNKIKYIVVDATLKPSASIA